jgi:hypothetical protein
VLEFGRRDPVTDSEGQKIQVAGRNAIIDAPTDADTCEVEVYNLTYTDAYGYHKDEMVYAYATSRQQSQEQRCQLAVQLATALFPPR